MVLAREKPLPVAITQNVLFTPNVGQQADDLFPFFMKYLIQGNLHASLIMKCYQVDDFHCVLNVFLGAFNMFHFLGTSQPSYNQSPFPHNIPRLGKP